MGRVFGYRGEERAHIARRRAERVAAEAQIRLPHVEARRVARTLAGGVALLLGGVLVASIVPRFEALDRWFTGGCKPAPWLDGEGAPCAPSWRPLSFFALVGVIACAWAMLRVAAYPWAKQRLAARMQRARESDTLYDLLLDESNRIERLERTSAAIPLLAAALLAPFAVHSFVVPGFGLGVFDAWMSVLGAYALPAQLALMGFTWLDTKRWSRASVRALEHDDSWKRAFWIVVGTSTVATAIAFQATAPSVRPHSGHSLLVLGACATFTLSWPLIHHVVRTWIVHERSELGSVSTLLEHATGAVRVDDLGAE